MKIRIVHRVQGAEFPQRTFEVEQDVPPRTGECVMIPGMKDYGVVVNVYWQYTEVEPYVKVMVISYS